MKEIIKMYREAHVTSLMYLAMTTIVIVNVLIYIFLISW
jgi:hypothetical protein